jgi:hypothetical protein
MAVPRSELYSYLSRFCRQAARSHRSRRVDIETPRGIAKIAGARDVVSFTNCARLVPGELHDHPLGHVGPHEVAHRGATKIVRDAAGAAGGHASLTPRFVEPALGVPLTVFWPFV